MLGTQLRLSGQVEEKIQEYVDKLNNNTNNDIYTGEWVSTYKLENIEDI